MLLGMAPHWRNLTLWTVLLLWTQPELGMASLVVVGLGFLQHAVYVQSSRDHATR